MNALLPQQLPRSALSQPNIPLASRSINHQSSILDLQTANTTSLTYRGGRSILQSSIADVSNHGANSVNSTPNTGRSCWQFGQSRNLRFAATVLRTIGEADDASSRGLVHKHYETTHSAHAQEHIGASQTQCFETQRRPCRI